MSQVHVQEGSFPIIYPQEFKNCPSSSFPQVIEISDYRTQLYDYLKNRMMAIAPNLTLMVGELVGARLISHAGNLQTEFMEIRPLL